jgi:glucuronoarabinoxylan endo-1,4-beta-xylanase
VNLCTVNQTMDGFGAADVFAGSALTSAQVTLFFDPTNGIGLTLLRMGIQDNGGAAGLNGGAYSDAKNAMTATGGVLKVWAAPWSPPAKWKTNDSTNGTNMGGTYDPQATLIASDFVPWATEMAGFPATFKTNTGFDLYAISAQNEPDWDASYTACLYQAPAMDTFVGDLGPMLHALTPPVKMLAAEPNAWDNLWAGDNYGNQLVQNENSNLDILATHDYSHDTDMTPTRPAPPAGVTQPIWETEMSNFGTNDTTMTSGVQVAVWVYAAITTGHASAWHYWWLINENTDNEGLLNQGGSTTNPPKRLYTLGNFSKFVRPGYVNVSVSGSPGTSVYVSAFKDPSSGKTAIVAVNASSTTASPMIYLSGGQSITQVTPNVTSASQNLVAGTAIAVSNSTFTASLPGMTVTTFVSN